MALFENQYGRIRLETTQWPMIMLSMSGQVINEDLIMQYLETMQILYTMETKFLVITDLREFKGKLSPRARHSVRQWTLENHQQIVAKTLGVVYVFTNPVQHLMFASFLALQPLPYPYIVCRDMASAFQWAQQKLPQQQMLSPKDLLIKSGSGSSLFHG